MKTYYEAIVEEQVAKQQAEKQHRDEAAAAGTIKKTSVLERAAKAIKDGKVDTFFQLLTEKYAYLEKGHPEEKTTMALPGAEARTEIVYADDRIRESDCIQQEEADTLLALAIKERKTDIVLGLLATPRFIFDAGIKDKYLAESTAPEDIFLRLEDTLNKGFEALKRHLDNYSASPSDTSINDFNTMMTSVATEKSKLDRANQADLDHIIQQQKQVLMTLCVNRVNEFTGSGRAERIQHVQNIVTAVKGFSPTVKEAFSNTAVATITPEILALSKIISGLEKSLEDQNRKNEKASLKAVVTTLINTIKTLNTELLTGKTKAADAEIQLIAAIQDAGKANNAADTSIIFKRADRAAVRNILDDARVAIIESRNVLDAANEDSAISMKMTS